MPPQPPKQNFWTFDNPKFRGLIYQAIALALLIASIWFLWDNTLTNMREKNIRAGFDFLSQPTGFFIGETLLNYETDDSYLYAILIGLLNTLRVAILGCVLATIIGTVVGIARLSSNYLVRFLASVYVESLRNIPVLVHLLAWYFFLTTVMPSSEDAINFSHNIYFYKEGLKFPHPVWHPAWGYLAIAFVIGSIVSIFVVKKTTAMTVKTGKIYRAWPVVLLCTLVIPGIIWQITGAPTEGNIPYADTFGYSGGGTLTAEFITILVGLTMYTSCFIAEIVRSGIQAVSKGQTEASMALGLSTAKRMRFVILPQALRVIIPPLTNQFLNLTKNSSLAVAVGYPDIVSILTTTQNQTGQAVECIALIAGVYLAISLVTSLGMNWYNDSLSYRTR